MGFSGVFIGGVEVDLESVDVALQLGSLGFELFAFGFKRLFFFFAEVGLGGAVLELFEGDTVGFFGGFFPGFFFLGFLIPPEGFLLGFINFFSAGLLALGGGVGEVDVGAFLFIQFGSGLFELHPHQFEVTRGVAHAGSGGLGAAGAGVVFVVLIKLIPRGEVDEVEQQKIANDEQQCLIHNGRLVGLDARGGLGVHDELLAGAADVMDFDEGDAQDAKDIGSVGDGKADAELRREHFDGKGEGGTGDADVEAHVEEVIFVFE